MPSGPLLVDLLPPHALTAIPFAEELAGGKGIGDGRDGSATVGAGHGHTTMSGEADP